MSKTKKKSSAGKSVLVFFIVFIVLEMLIVVGISRVFKNKDVTPSILGKSLYIMDGTGMYGHDKNGAVVEYVPDGSLVIADEGTPSKSDIKSAILCENVKDVGTSVFRLLSIEPNPNGEDGVTYNVFQSERPDRIYPIKASNIVGVTTSCYPTAGKIISFVISPFGMISCAVVPLFLLVLIELIIAIATHSSEDDEDEEEDDDNENDDENATNDSNVSLDDFLFNSENEGAPKMHIDDEISAVKEPASEPVAPVSFDSKPSDDSDIFDRGTDNLKLSDEIDQSYYEKASQLIDNPTQSDTVRVAKPTTAPRRRPAQRPARPAARPSSVSAATDASLEELMKLMEQEQAKLNGQIGKK